MVSWGLRGVSGTLRDFRGSHGHFSELRDVPGEIKAISWSSREPEDGAREFQWLFRGTSGSLQRP